MIIAGAGGAAHLPGMMAAKTLAAGARRAGESHGAERARLAAVDRADAGGRAGRHARDRRAGRDERGPARGRILGSHDPSSRERRRTFRRRADAERARGRSCHDVTRDAPARRDDRRARRRPARAACSRSPRGAWAIASTPSRPTRTARPRRSPIVDGRRLRRLDAVREFARAVDVLTFEFENIPAPTIEWAPRRARPCGRAARFCSSHRTGCGKRHFLAGRGFPVARLPPDASGDELPRRSEALGRPRS